MGFGQMDGLDLLGAEAPPRLQMSLGRTLLALGAGAVGALLIPKHRVLGFLNASALASNTYAIAKKERSFKDAAKRMGRHVVATAGSLAMPNHPAIGYVAGAVAADLLIDGEGGGIIEEWSRYEGARDGDIIDAKFTEGPPQASTALVKAK